MLNVLRLKTLITEKQHHYSELKKNKPGGWISKGDRSLGIENLANKIAQKENKPAGKR